MFNGKEVDSELLTRENNVDRMNWGRHDYRGLTIHYVYLLTIWHLFRHTDDQP